MVIHFGSVLQSKSTGDETGGNTGGRMTQTSAFNSEPDGNVSSCLENEIYLSCDVSLSFILRNEISHKMSLTRTNGNEKYKQK